MAEIPDAAGKVLAFNLLGAPMPVVRIATNQISVAEWPDGVYFLQIGRQVLKLVVQH